MASKAAVTVRKLVMIDDVNVCVAEHTTISITQQHLTDVGGKYFPETK